jgi:hypothetical protein
MGKNPDPGCTSRILFLRTSYQFFELIILKFFDVDPDPGSCQSGIQDGKVG